MTQPQNFLAFDLGAESGRAIIGQLEEQRLLLSELHRFPNGPVYLPDGLHWNILQLWSEITKGLALALDKHKEHLVSLGIDTWAVDFGLLDRAGMLIGSPSHYRDSRTEGMLEAAFKQVPRAEIFEQTGIQFLSLNSLYQLLAMVKSQSPALEIAETFLTIPDLLNYWLTGRKVCEFTNATTTQCYNPRRRDWATDMLARLKIPTHIFPEVVPPGTSLGHLLPYIARQWGLEKEAGPLVIAPACHDTGSAVAAVPAQQPGFAWISSGTWSVVGVEQPEPVINDQSLAYNFTNEGGVGDTFRFSRNVMGLWLVQECRRTWARQGEEFSYAELTHMAAEAAPFEAVIDPDYADFFLPGDMPTRIQTYCRESGQSIPQSKGAIIRCALEGIALKYRWVLERIESVTGQRLEPLHIVGGGTQNHLLSQFTANATGRPVITGPVEATAIGNIMMQAVATGHMASIAAGRQIVRSSFELLEYEPAHQADWEEAYGHLLSLMKQ